MRTTVKGKNLDIPDAARRYAERRMQRLQRILDDRSEAVVELSVEHHRSAETSHIVDVSLIIDGRPLRGSAHGMTYRAAVDEVVDKLERMAVDHKERPRLRSRPEAAKQILRSIADGTADPSGDEARVVKVKRLAIEPMFEEDAVSRMDELGHSFFMFVNAENEHFCVLYRRADGDYGLIEPVVSGGSTMRSHRRPERS